MLNKKVKNATLLKVDDIQFKSKLEAYTYECLKNLKIKAEYEKVRFILKDPFEFSNESWEIVKVKNKNQFLNTNKSIRSISIKPDFVYINEKTKTGFIIEVKGFRTDSFNLRWKLFKSFLSENNFNVDLFLPTSKKQVDICLDIIKNKNYG
jgi:hypothetical protein